MNPETQTLVQEIALAMFRVASVMKHEGLKLSLENMAAKLASEESAENICRAENLVIIGREAGNIKEINATVLLRELANLKFSLIPAVKDVDVTSIFNSTRPTEIEEQNGVILSEAKNLTPAHPSSQNDNNEGLPRVAPQERSGVIPAEAGIHSAKSEKNQDKSFKKATSKDKAKRHSSVNPDKIYDYIKEHKVARLKELEAAFSEVSGRTVRRITDVLIKDGRIERVGNPGPTSFYRLNGNLATSAPSTPVAPSIAVATPSSQPRPERLVPSVVEERPRPAPSVTPASSPVIPAEPSVLYQNDNNEGLPRVAPQERSGVTWLSL